MIAAPKMVRNCLITSRCRFGLDAIATGAMLVVTLCLRLAVIAQERPIAICSVGKFQPWIWQVIDPTYKKRLNTIGYQVGALEYHELNLERIKPFNVLMLQWAPTEGDTEETEIYRSKISVIEQFVREGGGVLVTCENAYGAIRNVNQLLQPFGIEILNESITDEKNLYRQTRYLQYYFCKTTNIDHEHPIGKGLKEIWYPLAHSLSEGYGTMPVKVLNGEWQIIVRAADTAHSSKGTYKSAPPILAARQYGKGRIVVFPTHTTYWINAGYHRIWEGICMEKGDGFKLLDNIYRWLAEPSIASGAFGGFTEPKEKAKPQPPTISPESVAATDVYTRIALAGGRKPLKRIEHTPKVLKDFVGIIGVRTDYSCPERNKYGGGWGSVAEYCQRAKKLGYSFIVFTDLLENMNHEKWEKLVADCKAQTGEDFVAIPGIEYENGWGDRFICFNMSRFPEKEWLSEDGKKVLNASGLYFGLDWPPLYLRTPHLNFTPPWFAKFYSGMELFSYLHGDRLVDEAVDWYRLVQGNDYNLIPIVNHGIFSPPELERAKGFKTHVLAESVKDIHKAFKYYWYAPRSVYVSNGPRIKEWVIENGRAALRDEPWRLYISVESDAPLKEVIVFDKQHIFRRFNCAGKTRFQTQIDGYHDRQRFFTMEVRDQCGGRAISSALYTSDLRHSTYMCTDLQNTLNSMFDVDPASGKFTHFGVMGGHVTGWDSLHPGILVPEWELMPPGLDYVVKGFSGGLSHVVYAEWHAPESAVARREIAFGCGDCNILDNYYETKLLPGSFIAPTELAISRARMISFTPVPYSYNIMLIEQEIQFLRDVTFPAREGPEVVALTISGPIESFENYSFINANGEKVTGKRDREVIVAEGTLPVGGYVALFPDFYGSFAIYSLDKPYTYRLEGATVTMGFELAGKKMKAGERLTARYLVVRGKFGEEDDAGFDAIRRDYGLSGKPAYTVSLSKGKVLDSRYMLQLQAEKFVLKGSVTRAQLPNPLPVTIAGLNEHWDAGLIELTTKTLRRVGVFEGKGYLTLDVAAKPQRFVAGNLVVCDQADVWLNLIETEEGWAIDAHNPTEKSLTVTVSIPSDFSPVLPIFTKRVTLPPGQTMRISVNK